MPKGFYCANFGGGQVDITSGNFVFSASESYLIEDGKLTRPVRNATLIGNGPEALKYVSMVGNDLRLDEGIGTCGKEGPERPCGCRHPDHQNRPHDRGRHCLNLLELANDVVRRALVLGATDAECTMAEGEEFSANVRMRELENLKEAGSRGAGLRILRGKHTGSSYTSDLSAAGIEHMVKSAVELADITTEDPHAGLPDPEELGSIPGDLGLYSPDVAGLETGVKIESAREAEEAALSADPRIFNSEGASFDTPRGPPRLRQLAWLRRRIPHQLLLAQRRAGGSRRRIHGARLLVHHGPRLPRPGAGRRCGAQGGRACPAAPQPGEGARPRRSR